MRTFSYKDDLSELPIQEEHRMRLQWFLENEGRIVRSIEFSIFADPFLTTKAQGIYVPKGSTLALSIRETLNSSYGDAEIVMLSGGDWFYRYHRESGNDLHTNRSLFRCKELGIPVGVIIQVERRPISRYLVAGLGRIVQFEDPWFDLVNWRTSSTNVSDGPLVAESASYYDAHQKQGALPGVFFGIEEDSYSKQLVRPNQPLFRAALLSTYDSTCAVTGTKIVPALEAAHIRPYSYEKIDKIQNGLLLRADVHRLFDRGYLGIDTSSMEAVLSSKLIGSDYEQYEGRRLNLPTISEFLPSINYLDEHRKAWKLS